MEAQLSDFTCTINKKTKNNLEIDFKVFLKSKIIELFSYFCDLKSYVDRIYGLDLFSGIGGISLAIEPWVKTIAYCERDRFAQSVLLSRMAQGELHKAPIWDDVTTLKGSMFSGVEPDIIFGGFPCQDLSVAGARKGLDGERSGLFFEILRIVSEIRPAFVFLENVPGIRTKGLGTVCYELADLGYDLRWTVVSAKEVGACHLRKRWFLLAHSNGKRGRIELQPRVNESKVWTESVIEEGNAANPNGAGLQSPSGKESPLIKPSRYGHWTSEPSVRRGAHGVQNRLDRLKCLGNSVVPIQARKAFVKLIGF